MPENLPLTITCPNCEGSMLEPQHDAVPCQPDGTIVGEHDFIEAPGSERSVETCWTCKGFKVTSRASGSYYKTAATAQRAIEGKKARGCTTCHGTGHKLRLMVMRKCYTCSGVGEVPLYQPGGVLGEQWSRCDSMVPVVADVFAHTVNLHVSLKSSLTWGEANLGLDGVCTIVDYGDRWKAARARLMAQPDPEHADLDVVFEPLKAEVREKLAQDRIQWIKVIDRETRAMAADLVIFLTKNGYSVKAANVAQARPILPPTYTDAVLDRPIG